MIKKLDAEIIQLETDISETAVSLVEQFYLSNSLEMGDALIAATCLKLGEPLCTANDKHYKIVENLKMEIFRP